MNKLYIAMYHYTRDLENSRYPGIKGLDKKLFIRQLDFFKENFNPVTMEEVLESIYGGGKLPVDSLLLTFDDGYADNFNVAFPLLKNRGMQGSFFVPAKVLQEEIVLDVNKIHYILASTTDDKKLMQRVIEELNIARKDGYPIQDNDMLIEKYCIPNRFDSGETNFIKRVLQFAINEEVRSSIASRLFDEYVGVSQKVFSHELYLNRDQISCMKKCGMYIGVHGYEHSWLGELSENEVKIDIEKSLNVLNEYIDTDRWVMNYPYGSYNENVCRIVKEKGCKLGLSTEVDIADLNSDDIFALPRLDCNDFPPKSENYLQMN